MHRCAPLPLRERLVEGRNHLRVVLRRNVSIDVECIGGIGMSQQLSDLVYIDTPAKKDCGVGVSKST